MTGELLHLAYLGLFPRVRTHLVSLAWFLAIGLDKSWYQANTGLPDSEPLAHTFYVATHGAVPVWGLLVPRPRPLD